MSLLTLKQASEQLNVSKMTICNWVKENKIEFIVLPNGIRRYKIENIVDKKKISRTRMELSTPESLLENKSTILKDKLTPLKTSIPTTDSLKTSAVESTTTEKAFKLWWTPYCKEMSQKLWLPAETDCVDSDLNCSSSSLKNTKQTSWFSTTKHIPKRKKWFRTSFPSLQSSPAGLMVLENTKIKWKKSLKHKTRKKIQRKTKAVEGLYRNYHFRLFPTVKQRIELRKWFGTARYCYNQVIAMYKKTPSLPLNYTTRNLILTNIPFEHQNVNLEVKRNGIKEAFDTIAKGGDSFSFRSKKSKQESIYVRKECISSKKNTVFPNVFGSISLKGKKLFKPEMDSRLVRKGNKYYLNLIKLVKPKPIVFKEGSNQNTICALDPGTHTFLDYYSNLDCGKIAPGAGIQVFRHCKRIDSLISKSSQLKSRLKCRLNRAITREREKLKNKITDLHWKTASFLCKKYDHIFLPHFETQEMSKKNRRKIGSVTVRKMLTLSHYLFSQRLVSKAEEMGTIVYKLHEPYTSQLCGNCFERNKGLKLTQRTYSCKNCHIRIDRDYNGARNIFLRGLWLLNEQGRNSLRWEVSPFQVYS